MYPELSVPQLAAVLHTYAKLQLLPGTPEFMGHLAGRLRGQLGGGRVDGKVLAMLAWSLARLGCSDTEVLSGERGAADSAAG